MAKDRKITLGEPVIISQNTTEPILFGGWQLPDIRVNNKKELFVKFAGRLDSTDYVGQMERDPVYKSTDGGDTWERSDLDGWFSAANELPNGDRFSFGENPLIKDISEMPEAQGEIEFCHKMAYTINEINESGAAKVEKVFTAYRIYAGTDEVVEEKCKVNWEHMPVQYSERNNYLYVSNPVCGYRTDKNGTMWMTVYAPAFDDNGKLINHFDHTHLLRSDDYGHTWDYVSTIVYKEEYNHPKSKKIEGFNETALEIMDDGSIIVIVRTGSIHPRELSTKENPFPILYFVKSTDGGKTWSEPVKFHEFGVRPRSVKLPDGSIMFVSGRPGIYFKFCDDPAGEEWSDAQFIMTVPEAELYNAFFEYSCYNMNLCVYDEKTVILAYSDFQRNAPDGKRAKSIMARKIIIE